MPYLIDTHVFLWFISNPRKLSRIAKRTIENGDNEIFISIAGLWEISIKHALGKLRIDGTYDSVIDDVNENFISILPVNFAHTAKQNILPFHHRDPFDRMIVSQAVVENINLISSDAIFDRYLENLPIKRVW